MKKKKVPPKAQDASGEEVAAAVKVQAIQRGRLMRKMEAQKHKAADLARGAGALISAGVGAGINGAKSGTNLLCGNLATLSEAEVVAPTPAGAWFSPASGWPQEVDGIPGWKAPPSLVPTESEVPDLFDPSVKIGEVRVEVLAATGLEACDQLTRSSDPYALVVFETNAARTNHFKVTRSPKWGPSHPRAFVFDVTRPFSCVYVALKDHDLSTTTMDDDMGRVVLELSTMASGVEYDAWYELKKKTYKKPNGKHGYVRLRYSVRFTSGRERFMRYAQPRGVGPFDPLPPFVVPMHTRVMVRNAQFATNGNQPGNRFQWRVFKSYVSEITELTEAVSASAGLQDLLFWRRRTALLSLFVCVAAQLLISYPAYLPSFFVLTLLFWLCHNYTHRLVIQPKPTKRARVGGAPSDVGKSADAPTDNGRSTERSLGSSRAALRRSSTKLLHVDGDPRSATLDALRLTNEDGSDSESDEETKRVEAGAKGSYAHMRENLQLEFDARLKAALRTGSLHVQSVDGEQSKKLSERLASTPIISTPSASTSTKSVVDEESRDDRFTVHPLAPILGPVQRTLGKLLLQIRNVRRILSWEDPYITAHITIQLVCLLVLTLVIPWGFVAYWSARLAALAAFGPHMHFVGKRLDAAAAEAADKERRYQQGNGATRAAMKAEVRAEMEQAMHALLAASTKHLRFRSSARVRADDFLDRHAHKLTIWPTRTSGRFRFRSTPILRYSRAYPLAERDGGAVASDE